jgi:hypothetical protein
VTGETSFYRWAHNLSCHSLWYQTPCMTLHLIRPLLLEIVQDWPLHGIGKSVLFPALLRIVLWILHYIWAINMFQTDVWPHAGDTLRACLGSFP